MRAYHGWLRAQGHEAKGGAPSDDEFEAAAKAAR